MRFRRIGVLIGLLWSVSAVRLHAAGDFSLSASPSLQTVVAGASTTCTITVTKSGGFSGVVSFNTSGLPAGAAASFSPATVTGSGTTTMTVSTTTSTPAVTSTLTVTGTSGSLVHTTTTTLKVVGYSLAASPGSQSVSQGATSSPYTVTVTPANGFNGTVSFSVTGLPTGATAAFNPASVSGGSGSTAMTVTVGASTPAGNSTLTITGTSGTSNRTTAVTLVVTGPPITYIYDAVGRLTGVIDPSGEKAIYTYDAVGNLLSIARQGPSVSIVSFTPASGPVGTQVTITGTGFSSQASQNTVKFFNNVTTTITSAATMQIVTSVPSGAATGPITVTSPSGTATSSASFTVTAPPGPPTIVGFTPTIASPSTMVTITGTNFDLDPSKNTVKFNVTTATVVSSTGTTLTTSVPQQATSGRITVQTAFGQATSTADFFVVPSPYVPTDVGFTGRISVDDPALTLSLTGAGQAGIVLFDGTQGQLVDLLTTALQTGEFCAPGVGLNGAVPQYPLPALPYTGTHYLLINAVCRVRMTMRVVQRPTTADFGIYALPDFPLQTTMGVTYSIFLTSGPGWNGNQYTNLSVTGLPAGSTASFNPPSARPYEWTVLTVNIGGSTPAGSYTLTITGVVGAISHSTTVTLNVNPVTSPWTSADIGSVGIAGLSQYSAGAFTVRGSGVDIWDTADSFQYVYQPLSGDGVITARVTDLLNAGGSFPSKMGVMIRETLTAGSANAFVGLFGSGFGTLVQYRSVTAGATSYTPGPPGQLPYWIRLVRQGNNFSGWVSADGAAWTQIDSTVTIPMASSVFVGLAVSAVSNSNVATGVFDNVSMVGTADFVLSASPLTQPVTTGSSVSYTVNVTALNNFAEPVTLSVTGLPAGAGASFTPPTITGSGTSTMSVTAGSSTPFGTYPLTITGTSATKSHSAAVSLVVGPPDFTVSASPASQTAPVGSGTSYTVTVGIVGAFAGQVTLSVAGVPAGATASLTPSSLTAPGTSTLTIAVGSNTPGRTYPLTIKGVSGAVTHSTTINLVVPAPDFSVSNSLAWLKLSAAGGTGSSTVTVSSLNNFSKIVNLAVGGLPAGASATFNPLSVTGSGSSTLTVTTTSSVPPGSYALTIKGTSPDALNANPSHAVTMALIVDATVGALPAGWANQDVGAVGISGSAGYSSGTFSAQGSGSYIWNDADSFHYAYQPLSGDGTIIARVASMQNTFSSSKAGVMIRESLSANAANAFMTLQVHNWIDVDGVPQVINKTDFQFRLSTGASSSSTDGPGVPPPYWVKLVRQGSTFTGYVSTDSAHWVQVGAPAGISMAASVYIGLAVSSENNSGVTTATFDNVTIWTTPDFYLTNTTASESVPAGGGIAYYTVNVNGVNGFSQTVNLSLTGLPSGATATFLPSAVTGTDASILRVTTTSATPAGTYALAVSGVAAAVSRSTTVTLVVNTSGTAGVPSPWANRDVGSASQTGSASYSGGAFTVSSWTCCLQQGNGSDGFHYLYQPLQGNGTILAEFTGTGNPNDSRGVMIRETLSAVSTHAAMPFTGQMTQGTGQPMFVYRPTNGSADAAITGPWGVVSAPAWSKLVRQGNSFTGYYSTDGATWNQVGSASIAMATNVLAGVAVTDFVTGGQTTSSFDSVIVSTTPEFYLRASPALATVQHGLTAGYSVIAGYLNGFSGTVSFSVSGLPPQATASFNPASLTSSGESFLTITTRNQSVGTWPLIITGTSGAMTRSVSVTLVVN